MTLVREIQQAAERLYRVDMGVDLERFVVSSEAEDILSGFVRVEEKDLTRFACLYFVPHDKQLNLAIYFCPEVLGILQQCDPRAEINDDNILPLMAMIEEITHALHLTLLFMENLSEPQTGMPDAQAEEKEITSEATLRALEVQAKIDTYVILTIFLLRLKGDGDLGLLEKLWLRYNVFEREDFGYSGTKLERRYFEVNELGLAFSIFLDSLEPSELKQELQLLRRLPFDAKRRYIQTVSCSGEDHRHIAA